MGKSYDLYTTDNEKMIKDYNKSQMPKLVPSYDTSDVKTYNYDISSGYIYSKNTCTSVKNRLKSTCDEAKNNYKKENCNSYIGKCYKACEDNEKSGCKPTITKPECRDCNCKDSCGYREYLQEYPNNQNPNECVSTRNSQRKRTTKDFYYECSDDDCSDFNAALNIDKDNAREFETKTYSDVSGEFVEHNNGDSFYYEEYHTCDNQCNNISGNEICQCVKGNSIDLNVEKEDCEVRADLVLQTKNIMRIWGQIKDNRGIPISDAIVSLLKPGYIRGQITYVCTATTVTDDMGFYQFELDNDYKDTVYKIIVSKGTD